MAQNPNKYNMTLFFNPYAPDTLDVAIATGTHSVDQRECVSRGRAITRKQRGARAGLTTVRYIQDGLFCERLFCFFYKKSYVYDFC